MSGYPRRSYSGPTNGREIPFDIVWPFRTNYANRESPVAYSDEEQALALWTTNAKRGRRTDPQRPGLAVVTIIRWMVRQHNRAEELC
jgi:hypothetical protein